jgi:hypothetical protein
MSATLRLAAAGFAFAAACAAGADFAMPGGPAPANIDEIAATLKKDPYDLELLISYGTSKGGLRRPPRARDPRRGPGRRHVYSANFYADRAAKHAKGFYTEDLMARIPKTEYLFKTVSSLADTTHFGLDYGEIYKRAVIGVRVYGVPAAEKAALAAFFARINDDYRSRARKTEYHDREVAYDYLRLNCAKTIASAFRYGAGYETLEVSGAKVLPARTRLVAALNANIPTETAMRLLAEWNKRGYGMDVVLYKKYEGSPYVDPHGPGKTAFKDLPNRFPSVLSRDFRKEQGRYRGLRQPLAMYLLYNLGKFSVRRERRDEAAGARRSQDPMPVAQAAELAKASARSDSDGFPRGQRRYQPKGTLVGESR